jgi:hypothetical protein
VKLREHKIRKGVLPYAIRACAAATPERNLIFGPPHGAPTRKRSTPTDPETPQQQPTSPTPEVIAEEPKPEPTEDDDYVPEVTQDDSSDEHLEVDEEPPRKKAKKTKEPTNEANTTPPVKKARKTKELLDVVTKEPYTLNVTNGNCHSGNWHLIPAGVKYFHCPNCDTAYGLGPKNPGYDSIAVNPAKDGRLPIDQEIPNDQCRHIPLWKKMRRHLHTCSANRELLRIRGNREEFQRYNSLSKQEAAIYLENEYYPPLFKQVKIKNNPALIKDKNGNRDQKYARLEREKRKIEAKVATAVAEALRKERNRFL